MDRRSLVATRDAIIEDKNFILATWLRGLYYGDTWFREIPKSIFMKNYHAVLENLIAKPYIRVKVACLKDDPEVILGYMVSTPQESSTTLHWVFVKSAWRGIGIAKLLVPENTDTVTHLTKVGLALMKKKPKAIFNPFNL